MTLRVIIGALSDYSDYGSWIFTNKGILEKMLLTNWRLRERMIKVRELFRDTSGKEFVIVTIPTIVFPKCFFIHSRPLLPKCSCLMPPMFILNLLNFLSEQC